MPTVHFTHTSSTSCRLTHRWVMVLSSLCILSLVGCSPGKASYDMVSVEGSVTLDGQAVEGANVVFHSESGPSAFGTTDSSGHFSLATHDYGEGAAPGSYLVQINSTPETKNAAGKSDSIPNVYHENGVELVNITAGASDSFTFALKSRPKASDYVSDNPDAAP